MLEYHRRLKMKNNLATIIIATMWIVFLLIMTVAECAARTPLGRRSTALLLAQTCVAEISLQRTTDECAIMWWVNKKTSRLRNRTLDRQTRRFNSYWKSRSQRARRPWIAQLSPNLFKPHNWPKHLSWRAHKQRWSDYMNAANRFVSGATPDRCPRAIDYGAPGEIPKSARRGLVEKIKCLNGATLQWYWGKRKTKDVRKSRRADASVARRKQNAQRKIQ